MVARLARWGLIALGVLFIAIQLVPYGRFPSDPPGRTEPTWDSPRTRELAARACFDCHSNQVDRPWYAYVAPVSWLIQRDIDEGRRKLNFSEWDRPQKDARESAEQVQKGKMPLPYYTRLHPSAELAPAERQALIQGLQATVGRGR